jgi:hypothetical protein
MLNRVDYDGKNKQALGTVDAEIIGSGPGFLK